MRALRIVPVVLALAANVVGQDEAVVPADVAFVELELPRTSGYVGEAVAARLRFGLEKRFLGEQAIQPFRVQLGVPVRVELDAVDGVAVKVVEVDGGVTVAFDDAVVRARSMGEQTRGGRTFVVDELPLRCIAARPGTIAIAAPRLRFAYATRFEEDFLRGRAPVDRHDAVVEGAPVELAVQPLPAAAPAAFTGAVGRFAVRAEASTDEVQVGDSLRLRVHVEGDGNLEAAKAPSVSTQLEGFHVYGWLEEDVPAGRTWLYDVAPVRADVTAVPPLAFAFFDPEPPGSYRTVHTEAIPLRVAPGAALPEAAPVVTPEPAPEAALPVGGEPSLAHDIRGLRPVPRAAEPEPRRWGASPVLAALALPWLLACGAWALRRRMQRPEPPPPSPHELAAARARAALRSWNDDPERALLGSLAAWLQCTPAAVVGPSLPVRLVAVGVEPKLAHDAMAAVDDLLELRYATHGALGDRDARVARAHAVVARLDRAFEEAAR